MSPLVPAHRPPVGGFRRGVAAGEAEQNLPVCRLGVLLALLAGERTGPSEQQPGGQLGRGPVSLPGVVLKSVGAKNTQVRCPDLPEPLDQRRAGLFGGVDLNRNEVLGDSGGDRRLAVADTSQRRAAASGGREEVDQDRGVGCPGLLAGGVQVSRPPLDRRHRFRLSGSGPFFHASRVLPDDVARVLVVPQPLEPRVAKLPGVGPLGERDLTDEPRLDPVHP
jgi:hypothetical protein